MQVWLTKYAPTGAVQKIEVEQINESGLVRYTPVGVYKPMFKYYHREDYALTREEAEQQVKDNIEEKRDALARELAELERKIYIPD